MYLNANASISACKPHFLHNSVFCNNSLKICWYLNIGSEAAMALSLCWSVVNNIPKTGNTMTAEPVPQAVHRLHRNMRHIHVPSDKL